MTFQRIAALMRSHPDKLLITGEDRFLGYSVMLGARAALIGMGAALPDLQAELLRAWRDRQYERFIASSALCDRLAQATFIEPMEGYIRRMLWAAAADGAFRRDSCDDPWGPALPAAGARGRRARGDAMRAQLERDFERFGASSQPTSPRHIREAYRIDLTARYLGFTLPHPIGKGSGQLSLNLEQLETDRAAGLAFVVLKTVIAEDADGRQRHGGVGDPRDPDAGGAVRSASGLRGLDGDVEGQGVGPLVRRLPGAGARGGATSPASGAMRRRAVGEVSSAAAG